VPFAAVALMRAADSVIVSSASATDSGTFRLAVTDPGSYRLRITAMGFQAHLSDVFKFSGEQVLNMKRIALLQTANHLHEVVIRAAKPAVAQTAEGLTVNVQNSLMTAGSSILDVLQRSPGVIVDEHNHTLSLNGKAGVLVMIDGRQQRLSMEQLMSMLSGMSADNIDKIELMNTPPAKYDAEGNAGVINIVTKKNKKDGTNGSLRLTGGYGVYEKASAGLNINHNAGKVNLYGAYYYGHSHDYGYLSAVGSQNAAIVGGQSDFGYTGISKPVGNYHSGEIGADIRPDTATTLGVNISYWGGNTTNMPHNYGYFLFDASPALYYNSLFEDSSRPTNAEADVYIDKNLPGKQKIHAEMDEIYYHVQTLANSQNSFTDSEGNPAGGTDSLFSPIQRDFGSTRINVLVGKADYSNQLTAKTSLEGGAKFTYSRTDANSGIENMVNGVWVPDVVGQANNFITYEAINAAYVSLHLQPDAAGNLTIGGRYEYSHNYTDPSADSNYRVDRKLKRFFPSLFFTRKINDHASWNLSYTERITRPSYDNLASYISYNSPVSVFTGNPLLKPTVTRNLKFGFSEYDFLFSLLFSRDEAPILGVQGTPGPVSGVVYLRPENADWENAITLQTTLPFKIGSWWEMSYTFTGGWRRYRVSFTPRPFEKGFMAGSFNFSEQFKFGHGISAELSGYYNSASYNSNWHAYSNTVMNLGLKKEFGEGKGSLKLTVDDLFRGGSYTSDMGYLTTDAFNSKVHVIFNGESKYGTIIKLTFSRPFGSKGAKTRERESASGAERSRL